MTSLHFAYGANMSRAVMRRYAPGAIPIGAAVLADHRFIITGDGYASVAPSRAEAVHGVLWRLTPRDRVLLDGWEAVSAGQYRTGTMRVRCGGRVLPALVYVARATGEGRPKPEYLELVIAAAREWSLPESYIATMLDWPPPLGFAVGARKLGDFR